MRCSSILHELTNWAIDRPDAALPERLLHHIQECGACRSEWESIRAWAQLLRPEEETWQPDEGFFERLTEQAMQEKRRASLTESTRYDLALDASGWFSFLQMPGYRWLPSLAFFLLIAIPLGYWLHSSISTIGEFDFSSGLVIAQTDRPLDPRQGMAIHRNTSIQTPQNAESIVHLDSNAEISIAALSRVTLIDERTVRVDHGKAYFNIAKQKSGFVVHLPEGEARVLGTAFEISVARGQSTITVTRGVVQVSNTGASVRVEKDMESVVVAGQHPAAPRQAQRLTQIATWVNRIQEQRNEEELRKYYPSLAAPTPKGK